MSAWRDLLLAEAGKALRAPLVRSTFVLSLVVPLLIIIPAGLTPPVSDLRFPASIARLGELLPTITLITPSLLMAWLVGVEQGADTWKTLLVRRPGRAGFLVAKFLVVLAIVTLLLLGTVVVWLPTLELVGMLAGQGRGTGGVAVDQALLALVSSLITAPQLLAVALLLTILVRRQGTIVGAFSGILCSVLTASFDAGRETPLFFLQPAARLAAGLLGTEAHPDLMVISPGYAALNVVFWSIVPLAIAAAVFQRRDIESGAA